MATTTTSNLETSGKALGIYFDTRVIESLQPHLYFEQFGTVETVPEGNYTSRFFTFNKIATSAVTSLTEGTAPTAISVSVNAIETTPTQYGISVEMTDLVALTSVFQLVNTTLTEVGKAMARKIDEVIQTVVNAGSNVIYSGGKTKRESLTSSDLISATDILKAVQKLRNNAAPEYAGGGYACVIHPSVAYDLMSNTSAGQWIDVKLKVVASRIKQFIRKNSAICWKTLKRLRCLLGNKPQYTGAISRYPHLNLAGSAA